MTKTVAPKTTARTERKIAPFSEHLPVVLTKAELLDYGEEIGAVHAELNQLEDQLSQAKSANKAAKEPKEGRVRQLADCLRSKKEVRPVEVQWTLDFPTKVATLIRLDTGEEIRTRPVTQRELQESLLPAES